jgi:hypothetical protein
VAHDCGQIINSRPARPSSNIVQERQPNAVGEVKFDTKNVTTIDWMTNRSRHHGDAGHDRRGADRPSGDRPTGGGEPSFVRRGGDRQRDLDATGVRIRRVPFSPDRVKQALS